MVKYFLVREIELRQIFSQRMCHNLYYTGLQYYELLLLVIPNMGFSIFWKQLLIVGKPLSNSILSNSVIINLLGFALFVC